MVHRNPATAGNCPIVLVSMQNPTRVDAFFYLNPDSCGVAHVQK